MSEWETVSGPDDGWETVKPAKRNGAADPTEGMSTSDKFWAGAGKAIYDVGRGAGQFGRSVLPAAAADAIGLPTDSDIAEARKLDSPLMKTTPGKVGNVAGNVMATLPAAFVPGANTMVGASLIGGGLGALQPTVGDESRLKNTLTSGALGAAGFGLGKVIGKGVSAAGKKMAGIEQKVAEKAAAQAASETASARSAAGSAAQDAYRQLEHLRDLKALGLLDAEGKKIYAALSKELAAKAADKLPISAGMKQSTSEAYKEAIKTESARAAQYAAEKLSGSEVKQQIAHRVKRYAPVAIGGIIGNAMFPGIGAIGGATAGYVYRPMIHSIKRLMQNPAVQHKLLSTVANNGLLEQIGKHPELMGLLGPSIYSAE